MITGLHLLKRKDYFGISFYSFFKGQYSDKNNYFINSDFGSKFPADKNIWNGKDPKKRSPAFGKCVYQKQL